jgi:hypothetical protein
LPANDQAQQPAHAGKALKHEETSIAWPVWWSSLFGQVLLELSAIDQASQERGKVRGQYVDLRLTALGLHENKLGFAERARLSVIEKDRVMPGSQRISDYDADVGLTPPADRGLAPNMR